MLHKNSKTKLDESNVSEKKQNSDNVTVIATKENDSIEISLEAKKYINHCNDIMYNFNNILIKNPSENYPTELLNKISKYNIMLMRFVVIDTKRLTFLNFYKHEYLCCPIVTDYNKISTCLQFVISELERRRDLLIKSKNKNIVMYNEKQLITNNILPYYFLVVNDIYDIRMISKESYEILQQSILNGHEVGIITVMFSNVINKYLKLDLVKSCIIEYSQEECNNYIANMLYDKKEPEELKNSNHSMVNIFSNLETRKTEEFDDPIYDEIVRFAIESGKISASLIQRRFKIGYNRAARLINLLEKRGVIGPSQGSRPREVLIQKH